MNILQEELRSNLNISNITSNAINKHGLGNITFKSASLKYPDSLEMNFSVLSSRGKGEEKHFSGNGDELLFSGGYKVTIQFINFGSIAPPNLLSMPLSQQIIYLKEIFDKANIKVSCDCGAFYWQGNSELLDRNPPDANYKGFTGQYGKGIWDALHNTKNRICKHIYHVLEKIETYIPKILKDINKGTSISSSTTQNASLVAPQKPAGIPEEKGKPTTTIQSDKAENTVKKDVDEAESASDRLDLPKTDISSVEAKTLDKNDVISGPNDSEPPIEEITKAKDVEEDDMNEELEEIKESKSFKEILFSSSRN
jgi:hypothetical protein